MPEKEGGREEGGGREEDITLQIRFQLKSFSFV